MTDADVRKRCEDVAQKLWHHWNCNPIGECLCHEEGKAARLMIEPSFRAAYADGQRDGMDRAAKVAKRNVYMGKECDEGGNFGGPASCEYGCGGVIADAIRQAAEEVGRG